MTHEEKEVSVAVVGQEFGVRKGMSGKALEHSPSGILAMFFLLA